MRYLIIIALMQLAVSQTAHAAGQWTTVYDGTVKSVQAVVGDDWQGLPILRIDSDDVLHIGFDNLSHETRRYVYHIDHCEPDWSPSTEIFESDYLEGFNDSPVDDYAISINTTVDYTHYDFSIPNERCRLRIGGNYTVSVYDEETQAKVFDVRFMVLDERMSVGIDIGTNTDIDVNGSHQQVSIAVNYGGLNVTDHREQIQVAAMQNGDWQTMRSQLQPTFVKGDGLQFTHNRNLIFDAGNEYRKFEILDVSHTTMGLDEMSWDGHNYHAYPTAATPRTNYLYDVDANGAFHIRNSDNTECDITCDYVFVHYTLHMPFTTEAVYVDGLWATDANREHYRMAYDDEQQAYALTLLQKQGYYNYKFACGERDTPQAIDGNFFQTENQYQAFVYYRSPTDRTWNLTGYIGTRR